MIKSKKDKKVFKFLRINTKAGDGNIFIIFEDVQE